MSEPEVTTWRFERRVDGRLLEALREYKKRNPDPEPDPNRLPVDPRLDILLRAGDVRVTRKGNMITTFEVVQMDEHIPGKVCVAEFRSTTRFNEELVKPGIISELSAEG